MKNTKIYYILFFVLFAIFFIFNLFKSPKDMIEPCYFDTAIRVVEYQICNNLSLAEMDKIWRSVSGSTSIYSIDGQYGLYTTTLYGAPLYSLIRFYLLKLPFHPMITFNILNLIVAILFFYASYLLIKLLFDNDTAIKSLLILLSFYGVYTVTRFAGRGYLVIGLAFILFGCYFIWKSMILEKHRYLIYAGIFMGLSWTAGNLMSRLTPGFLLVALIFYIANYFKQNNFSVKNCSKLLLNLSVFSIFFVVTSVVIIKIISYKFNLDFNSLLLNKKFRIDVAVIPMDYGGVNALPRLLRRLRLLTGFINYGDYRDHTEEFLYGYALIPNFFVPFLCLSIFYLKKNFKLKKFQFIYVLIFAASLFVIMFVTPQWSIRYTIVFLPFWALLVFLGIKYYFEVLAIKIKNEIYRKIVSGIIIIVIAIIYLSKIHNVFFGDYAKSWNNSQFFAGHRFATDSLVPMRKKYNKTITLYNDFMFSDQLIAYLDFSPDHKYKSISSCLDLKAEESESLPKLFEKYTKECGKVFVIISDGWHYGRLVSAYPNIKLELIKKIKLPKLRSFHGTGLKLYCVNGI